MKSSAWMVLILGVVGIAIITLLMMVTFSTFQDSPAGAQTRLANTILEAYGFESVSAQEGSEGGRTHVMVRYITAPSTPLDPVAEESEMRSVAIFALQNLPENLKKALHEVRIHRTEWKGSGCWKEIRTSEYSMPNPGRDETLDFKVD